MIATLAMVAAMACPSFEVRGLAYAWCGSSPTVSVVGDDTHAYVVSPRVWAWSMLADAGADERLGA